MKRELCDCLVKRLPENALKDFFRMPERSETGLYVLPNNMAPALSCFDIGVSAG